MAATAGFAFMGLNSAAGGYFQSRALKSQAEFQRQQYETNSLLSELQASDAIRRGDKEAAAAHRAGEQMIGAQRAALAANNVDVNFGSARDIQEDTFEIAEKDKRTIKNNAWREAWGYKMAAVQASGAGRFAEAAGMGAARNTMLSGLAQAGSWGLRAKGEYDDRRAQEANRNPSPSPRVSGRK